MESTTDIDLVLLILRGVAGLTLAAHGWNKFFGGGRIAGTGRWFDSIGMRPGRLNALLAASSEMGAGVLLTLGLLTPVAAAGVIGVMVVAGWTVHRSNGFFIIKEGWEYVFTGLGHAGSGRLVARRGVRDRRRPRRLDRLLDRPPARRGRRGPADAGVLPAVESGSGGLSGRRS